MDDNDLCVTTELNIESIPPDADIYALPDDDIVCLPLLAELPRPTQTEEITQIVRSDAEREATLAELERVAMLAVIEREY